MKQETILEKRRRQSDRIRQMTVAAMLSAITALLVFTPIGMIQLPPPLLAVTTVHVPVLIAALVEGWWVGGFVGLVFGVCSLIRALESGAVGLTLFFRNPLISVLPRILFPLGAYAVYLLLKKLFRDGQVRDKIAAGIAAAVGAILNTVLVLGTLYLIYGAKLTELVNNMISAGNAEAHYLDHAGAWLVAAVGLPNGIAEAVVAALLVPMVKVAVDAVTKRKGRKQA